MNVEIVAATQFKLPRGLVPWEPDDDAPRSGQQLAEFAGRACYQSWKRPNPETATNAGYIRHILEVGHLSVLEHGTVTFYLTGVSRSLTHELIRHRHFSYSQLSQRYVPGAGEVITPDVIAEDPELAEAFNVAVETSAAAYETLRAGLEMKFADLPEGTGKKKAARQAARSVLPNATETKIVVTGNYRALRHFIHMRATEHADVEIRALAITMLRLLQVEVPNVFADYEIRVLADGTEVASSPMVTG